MEELLNVGIPVTLEGFKNLSDSDQSDVIRMLEARVRIAEKMTKKYGGGRNFNLSKRNEIKVKLELMTGLLSEFTN